MKDRVFIFDTTLRDGEQSPGISLNRREKQEIAEQLARLNVDVIEAGFPVASPEDFEAVKAIAETVRGPVICALSRTDDNDIDRAWEAVRTNPRPRIHTFISTSPIHMAAQLKLEPAQVLEKTARAVRRAKQYTSDVEFSAMDATRSDPDFLARVLQTAVDCGAAVINIPDTVGYILPHEYAELIARMFANVKGLDKTVVSVHCHDDLGLAVANSLAAVRAGARQVECAVNGIGERAGNASLEEMVMILDTRSDQMGFETGVNTQEIARASRLISRLTGYDVSPNKAIVGANAFAHESGIHQDGVLKNPSTYEIMKPDRIGRGESNIVLGKHSGRHAFRNALEELGHFLTGEGLDRAFARFKDLADIKKKITDLDLEALAADEMAVMPDQYLLDYHQSSSGAGAIPIAAVRLSRQGKFSEATATGDGQVDALCTAIRKATHFDGIMISYKVGAISGGVDAQGEVSIVLEQDGKRKTGRAARPDIVEASARAYLNAINRLEKDRK
jgi:2-isopropylmalate synthase